MEDKQEKLPLNSLNEEARSESIVSRFRPLLLKLVLTSAIGLTAVAVFLLTNWLILPQDRLQHLVPDKTISYLHADLSSPTRGSNTALSVPYGLMPDEAARISLERHDQILSGWLIQWRGFNRPTDKEKGFLDNNEQVSLLSKRTWLIGETTLQNEVNLAIASGSTLSKHKIRSAYLKTARRLAPLQFLIDVTALSDEHKSNNPVFSSLDQVIVGAAQSTELDQAVIMTIDQGPAKPNYRLKPLVILPDYWTADSTYSLSAQSAVLDWTPILFGEINDWRLASGLDPASLPHPEDIYSGPLIMNALATSGPDGESAFQIIMPEGDLESMAARISQYLDSVLPKRQSIILPDRDQVTELVLLPKSNTFTAEEDDPRSLSLWNTASGYKLYLRELNNSLILSNTPIEQQNILNLSEKIEKCGQVGGNRVITTTDYLEPIWTLAGIDSSPQSKLRLFITNTPNLWKTCALLPFSVDK